MIATPEQQMEIEVAYIVGALVKRVVLDLEEEQALPVGPEQRKRLGAALRSVLTPEVTACLQEQAKAEG